MNLFSGINIGTHRILHRPEPDNSFVYIHHNLEEDGDPRNGVDVSIKTASTSKVEKKENTEKDLDKKNHDKADDDGDENGNKLHTDNSNDNVNGESGDYNMVHRLQMQQRQQRQRQPHRSIRKRSRLDESLEITATFKNKGDNLGSLTIFFVFFFYWSAALIAFECAYDRIYGHLNHRHRPLLSAFIWPHLLLLLPLIGLNVTFRLYYVYRVDARARTVNIVSVVVHIVLCGSIFIAVFAAFHANPPWRFECQQNFETQFYELLIRRLNDSSLSFDDDIVDHTAANSHHIINAIINASTIQHNDNNSSLLFIE